MKVSLSWLKDYIAINMDAADLADALTMVGLEVESVADRYDYLGSVVVGGIEDVSPHPNADKLKICRVNTGDGKFRRWCVVHPMSKQACWCPWQNPVPSSRTDLN